MPTLATDDRVRRYQGRWIDIQGWRWPWTWRYSTWFIGGAIFCTVVVICRVPPLGLILSWSDALVWAAVVAPPSTWKIAKEVRADRGVRGLAEITRNEVVQWFRARRHTAAAAQVTPYKIRMPDQLDPLQEGPPR